MNTLIFVFGILVVIFLFSYMFGFWNSKPTVIVKDYGQMTENLKNEIERTKNQCDCESLKCDANKTNQTAETSAVEGFNLIR